jgi:hypothetical protein
MRQHIRRGRNVENKTERIYCAVIVKSQVCINKPMMTKNEKISATLKARYASQQHPTKGKAGWKHSEEQKELKRQKNIEAANRRGRVSEQHKKARNKANVYAWRARKYNAIVESSDLNLIKQIYEHCPNGYHVDHIIALANGGLHHQDNLQYLPISENCRKGKDRAYDASKALSWKEFIPGRSQGGTADC